MDLGARRRALTLLHRASSASGFENAARAMAMIVENGRPPDEARRVAQGDPPDADDGADRLTVYDGFNNPGEEGRHGGEGWGPGAGADTRRRRASAGRRMDEIMELAGGLPLTGQVLADSLGAATPAQMDFMFSWMNGELASKERSKRSRLPEQVGLPAVKELDGYDWMPAHFPVDYGREALESLDFITHGEDVVLFGPPGTGKTHLAIALARKACVEGIPTRFFTAAGLVMRLLREFPVEGGLDRELAQVSKAGLLMIDELGYVPVDEEGSRLLFQVVTNAYERQSVIYTTNTEFSGWGRVFGDPNTATAIVDRTVHRGRMIRFEGESYRRTHALMG